MIRNIASISVETHHEKNEHFGYVGHLLVDGDRVFASGGSYGKLTLLASPDGGQTFVKRTNPPTSGLRSLSKFDGMLAVCGEHGTLALSDDAGLTWTLVPVPSRRCLFGVHEDADGVRWVIGDGGFVARAPRGSLSFEPVDSGTDTRLLRAFIVDNRLWVLGFDGIIRVWKDERFESLSVRACASLPDAYLLGDRGGYVWCVGADGERRWYCFLGSSLTSMELSEDKKTLLVGSYAGYLVEIDLTAEGRDPSLLTNGNLRETARWVFWRGHKPMIW